MTLEDSEKKWRDETSIESAGAEMLVCGRLMIDGIQAYRAYARQPGYDVVAINPNTQRSIKIQVKSRVAKDSGGFVLGHPEFDFVVFVRLNRGTKKQRRQGEGAEIEAPEFFVVPSTSCGGLIPGGKLRLPRRHFTQNGEFDQFKERWDLIRDALDKHKE